MNTRHHYLSLLRTFALAILTAAAVTACTDDNGDPAGSEPITPADGIPVTFTANINPGSDADPAGAPDTRTVLEPDGNGGFTVKWIGKDQMGGYDNICIWANNQEGAWGGSSLGSLYNPIDSDISSRLEPQVDYDKVTLSSPGEWNFTAIYGYTTVAEGRASISISSLTQSAPGNTDHIAKEDFSVATITRHVERGDMPDIGLQFKHMLSALQLQVKNGTGAALTVKEIRLSVTGDKITSYKKYGVIAKDWITDGKEESDYLQLKIKNPAALASNDGTVQKFHMLLFPGYENKTLAITVITDRGEYTLTKGAPTGGFLAGKNYLTDITITSTPGTGETWSEYVDISTADELKTFRDNVNNGNTYQGKIVRLFNNIDLADASWAPIGNSTNKFQGTFDGRGYSISGLNVDTGSEGYAGLFGYIIGGTVRNLRVSGTVKTTGYYAGGIVGKLGANSTIENCIFSGTVNGGNAAGGIAGQSEANSQITGCYTSGTVKAARAGGIIGQNGGSINDCYSSAMVEATGYDAGGIAGSNFTSVTRCYAMGAISSKNSVGGIVGTNFGQRGATVENCIALNPSLTRTSGSESRFGRIMGLNNNDGTITNCGAFAGMTLPDGVTATPAADGIHGADLSREQCVTEATYTDREFTTANGWGFDTGVTWTYLPWNKAFENFHSLYPRDYRISVPDYLNNGTN